jgi:hypothetical protein
LKAKQLVKSKLSLTESKKKYHKSKPIKKKKPRKEWRESNEKKNQLHTRARLVTFIQE